MVKIIILKFVWLKIINYFCPCISKAETGL